MKNEISTFLDAEQERQIAFLKQLIGVQTDNPPGDCAAHSALTGELLEGLGFEVEYHPVPEATVTEAGMISATNLIVRHRFGDGPTIALNAHGDVVPPGSGWTHDPYGGEIIETDDGRRIYGRGAAVSKSDIASYAWVLLALKEGAKAGAGFRGTVELHITYDEEIGGTVGPGWILEQGLSAPDFVICAGFSYAVVTTHNGCLHLETTVTGKIGHAAEPERAVDALEVTNAVLSALYESRGALSEIRSDVPGIESPTLVIGTIEGGINTNVVPDQVKFRLDRRLLPEEDVDAVEQDLIALIHEAAAEFPEAEISVERIMLALPLRANPGWEAIAEAIRSAAKDVIGEEIPYVGAKLFTDARLYAEQGIPVVLYGAGPRTLAQAGGHGSDENLDLADLRIGTEVVARAVADLLMVPADE